MDVHPIREENITMEVGFPGCLPLPHCLRQRTQHSADHTPLGRARPQESTHWGVWRPRFSFWLWYQPAMWSQGTHSLPSLVSNMKQSPNFKQRKYCPPSRHIVVLPLNFRHRQNTYNGTIRLTAGFSSRLLESGK